MPSIISTEAAQRQAEPMSPIPGGMPFEQIEVEALRSLGADEWLVIYTQGLQSYIIGRITDITKGEGHLLWKFKCQDPHGQSYIGIIAHSGYTAFTQQGLGL